MNGRNPQDEPGATASLEVAGTLKGKLREVFDDQEKYKLVIEGQVINMKKLNRSGRALEKLESFWSEIKAAWVAFCRNDQQLRELGIMSGPYFETKAKESLQKVVNEGVAFIKKHFPEIVPSEFDNSKTMDLSLLKTPARGPRRSKSATSLSGIDEEYWEDTVSELNEDPVIEPPKNIPMARTFSKQQDPHNLPAGLFPRGHSTNKKDTTQGKCQGNHLFSPSCATPHKSQHPNCQGNQLFFPYCATPQKSQHPKC